MLSSIRTQLAFWFTAVLALVLLVFGVSAYLFLKYTIRLQTDNTLQEISHTFTDTIRIEKNERKSRSDAQLRAILEAMEDVRFRNYQVFVFDAQNNVFQPKDRLPNEKDLTLEQINKLATDFSASTSESEFFTLHFGKDDSRLFAQKNSLDGEAINTFVIHSLDDEEELLEKFRDTLLISGPAALILACLCGYFLARKSLSPVAAMTESASRISAANLDERLPVKNEKDELGHLATVFNSLLARIENSFEQQRRFMADASHELRTPLSIIRGESEVTLSKTDRPPEELRESLAIVHDESKRLSKTVEDLFTMARADANQLKVNFREIYLDEILSDCVRKMRVLAEKRDVLIESSVEEMATRGDEQLLHQLFINLLDNAVKYNRKGGKIKVVGKKTPTGGYEVLISDTGIGIAPDEQPKIFERFYRADKARTRRYDTETGSAGLGMAIALWIARQHQGSIEIVSSSDEGTVFAISLPRLK